MWHLHLSAVRWLLAHEGFTSSAEQLCERRVICEDQCDKYASDGERLNNIAGYLKYCFSNADFLDNVLMRFLHSANNKCLLWDNSMHFTSVGVMLCYINTHIILNESRKMKQIITFQHLITVIVVTICNITKAVIVWLSELIKSW